MSTLLKELIRQQHLSYESFRAEYAKAASQVAPEAVAPSKAQFHRWLAGQLKGGVPYPDACRVLEHMFPPWPAGQLFEPWESGRILPLPLPNGDIPARALLDAVPPSFAVDAIAGHWVTCYQFDHGGAVQHHADIACVTGSGRWVKATNHPPAPRSGDRAIPFCNQVEARIASRHLIGGWKNTSDTRYFGGVQLAVLPGETVMEGYYTGFASDVAVSMNYWRWVRLESESVARADLGAVVLREPSALYDLVVNHSQTAAPLTLADVREEA
jgi:hypothetical protein